jgi:hypothetical protein
LKAYLYFAPAGTEWSEGLGWSVFEPGKVTFTFGPAVMSATSKAGGTRTLDAEWSVPEGTGAVEAGDGVWTITVPAGEEPQLKVTGTAAEGTASATVRSSWKPTLKAYLYFAPAGAEWSEDLGWSVFEPGRVTFTCPAGQKAHIMAPWPVEVTQFGLSYCMDPVDAETPWGMYMRYEALEPTNGLEQIIDVRKI